MNKSWYNIAVAEGSTEAEISIYDAIGGYEVNAKQFAEDLKAVDAETIHLRINSPGGSVIDGNAIFNALQRHSAKVITHIDGLAASMASVVAMAGDEICMADNALLMIHNPWTISMGNADELRADADLLDKMRDGILSAYSRSQYEPAELIAMMDEETWLTAQEALDAGFVDEIEGGLRAAASDLAAFAKSSGIEIPAEKQIAAMSKQIDSLDKIATELSGKLDAKSQELVTVSAELVDARAEVEAAELAKAEAEKLVEESKVTIEAKDAEIESAKEITEAAVAQKAAEITQSLTHAPVAEDKEEDSKLAETEFWEKYHSITNLAERNSWYKANKHRKI